jgi:hypothetical protein
MGAPMKLLALDLATELGWALGPTDGDPKSGIYKLPKGAQAGEFGKAFHRWLHPLLREEKPDVVTFEAPLHHAGGHTNAAASYKLQGLCFYTETLCGLLDVRCYQSPAVSWKKAICGTGRVSKSMKPYPPFEALAQRGFNVTNNNEADALCLRLYALGCLDEKQAARFDPLARKGLF